MPGFFRADGSGSPPGAGRFGVQTGVPCCLASAAGRSVGADPASILRIVSGVRRELGIPNNSIAARASARLEQGAVKGDRGVAKWLPRF